MFNAISHIRFTTIRNYITLKRSVKRGLISKSFTTIRNYITLKLTKYHGTT